MATSGRIGFVQQLWRYPVKSMLGEALTSVLTEPRGMRGDRVCALVDCDTGKLASAKLPHRWQELLQCQAGYDETGGRVAITLPGGRCYDAAEAGAPLSRLVGRAVEPTFTRSSKVTLDRADPDAFAADEANATGVAASVMLVGLGAPEGGFFDGFPLHLLTTASLVRLGAEVLGGAEAIRFRPNIVIDTDDSPPFVENNWPGGTITVGGRVQIAIIFPTPRCAVPALAHGDVALDVKLLHALRALNTITVPHMGARSCLGAYGTVITPGTIALGDEVVLRSA